MKLYKVITSGVNTIVYSLDETVFVLNSHSDYDDDGRSIDYYKKFINAECVPVGTIQKRDGSTENFYVTGFRNGYFGTSDGLKLYVMYVGRTNSWVNVLGEKSGIDSSVVSDRIWNDTIDKLNFNCIELGREEVADGYYKYYYLGR